MPLFTLLDILKANAATPGTDLVMEAVVGGRRELEIIPSGDPILGTEVSLEVCTALPTAAFRKLNEGSVAGVGDFTTRLFQLAHLDQQIAVDRALAARAKNQGAFLANRSMPALEAALDHICKQFWYGVTNDAKGFIGLIAQANSAATHTVTATGATAKSSVFLLTAGREKVDWVWGNNSTIYMDPEWKEETIFDGDDNPIPGLVNWIHGAVGMRLANKNACVRIKAIGAAEGTTLTDDLLFAALKLASDLGQQPTSIWMAPRSLEQWRGSRVATNATGAPVPLPRDFEGIPVYASRFISIAETI